jgi:hypothetical protein
MTATLDAVTTRRRKDGPEPSAEQKVAEELVAPAREQGASLTGRKAAQAAHQGGAGDRAEPERPR